MLENEPPPGTRVVLLQDVTSPTFRTTKAYEVVRLGRALQPYVRDNPSDMYEIEVQGEIVKVRRDQIRKAPG